MNSSDQREWHRLFNAALNDQLNEADKQELAAVLKSSAEARQLWFLYHDNECSLAELKRPVEIKTQRTRLSWLTWRPLTAAAAGIVFGMFCTSVVYGFVAQRAAVMKKVPLMLFDPGFEDAKQIVEDGLTHRPGQWGMDLAKVVPAEGDVKPLQGQGMMRLDPLPRDEDMKNRPSRAYQVLDLRSLDLHGEAEVEVTASFCAARSDLKSRYVMRVFALDEAPEQATHDFWPKVEGDGIPSETQRFDIAPGDAGWHTFSLKLRLPPDSKTLMLILGSSPHNDIPQSPGVHYLDDVQVSLITPQTTSIP